MIYTKEQLTETIKPMLGTLAGVGTIGPDGEVNLDAEKMREVDAATKAIVDLILQDREARDDKN